MTVYNLEGKKVGVHMQESVKRKLWWGLCQNHNHEARNSAGWNLDEGYAFITGWKWRLVEHQEGESARREAYYTDSNDSAEPPEVLRWLRNDSLPVPILQCECHAVMCQ